MCPRTHFFGKLVPFATVGKLVEAVVYMPRLIYYNEPASELGKEGVVVDQVLSKG